MPMVCKFWLLGRCNRHPCHYLHPELPQHRPAADGGAAAAAVSQNQLVKKTAGGGGASVSQTQRVKKAVVLRVIDQDEDGGVHHRRSNVWARNPHLGSRSSQPAAAAATKDLKENQPPVPTPPLPKRITKIVNEPAPPSAKKAAGVLGNGRSNVRKNPNTCSQPAPVPKRLKIKHEEPSPLSNVKPISNTESNAQVDGEVAEKIDQTSIKNCFSRLAVLEGHKKEIVGIVLPPASNKLYTASRDGMVKIWDCQTAQSIAEQDMGCQISCMFCDCEGPWVFIGADKSVQAWNTETGLHFRLNALSGQVHAVEVGNDMVFAGMEDGSILVWKPTSDGNGSEPATVLSGHQGAVISVIVGAMMLYSGSTDNTIRVWDLMTLKCINVLTGHKSTVTSLLCWEQFLLSCSLDQTVKVWGYTDNGLEEIYTHREEHSVLKLCGMYDDCAKPVLLCAYSNNTIGLYDLPSFSVRGKICSNEIFSSIQRGPLPTGLFFTGNGVGELQVWKWLPNESNS